MSHSCTGFASMTCFMSNATANRGVTIQRPDRADRIIQVSEWAGWDSAEGVNNLGPTLAVSLTNHSIHRSIPNAPDAPIGQPNPPNPYDALSHEKGPHHLPIRPLTPQIPSINQHNHTLSLPPHVLLSSLIPPLCSLHRW